MKLLGGREGGSGSKPPYQKLSSHCVCKVSDLAPIRNIFWLPPHTPISQSKHCNMVSVGAAMQSNNPNMSSNVKNIQFFSLSHIRSTLNALHLLLVILYRSTSKLPDTHTYKYINIYVYIPMDNLTTLPCFMHALHGVIITTITTTTNNSSSSREYYLFSLSMMNLISVVSIEFPVWRRKKN